MRYLGNKESIAYEILKILKELNLCNKNLKFFDAFCGTGSVSDLVKDKFDLIINDNLIFASNFAMGRLIKEEVNFSKLGFNPICFFNSNNKTYNGFFKKNYCPNGGRMYFSNYNSGRIDYFRYQIEQWYNEKKINKKEYIFLLACLLESVSKVANIAGVYGAYLKKWDPRALKEIKFIPIENINRNKHKNIEQLNCNLNLIIDKVECDVLYLDPPYTKNKYSVQYHILETLIRNDDPEIKGITGCRDMSFIDNNWSKPKLAEIELDRSISKTRAKHIILSYSSDGIMSKDYILNIFKRYCIEGSIKVIKIPYKKYKNSKTSEFNNKKHFEYIFYGERKENKKIVYCCPLNYMGGKSNVMNVIKEQLTGRKVFFDLMGGGFNVGINAYGFDSYIYNDTNFYVKDIVKMFKEVDTLTILRKVEQIIKKYKLEKGNKTSYIEYRKIYNSKYRKKVGYEIYLFTLILFGFQQQIRFNSSHEFNNPVGESGYNDSIKEKIVSFSRRIKELDITFFSNDFSSFESLIKNDSMVYIDPPYLVTLGSYNDGKRGFNGWTENDERRLCQFMENIKKKKCSILLSNIIEYKSKKNNILFEWIEKNKPKIINSTVRRRKEVLIIYETSV